MRQIIKASEILEYLSQGMAKKKTSSGYLEEVGSIEETYNLTTSQVDELFRQPVLKNAKTKPATPWVFEDDITNNTSTITDSAEPSEMIPTDMSPSEEPENGSIGDIPTSPLDELAETATEVEF